MILNITLSYSTSYNFKILLKRQLHYKHGLSTHNLKLCANNSTNKLTDETPLLFKCYTIYTNNLHEIL